MNIPQNPSDKEILTASRKSTVKICLLGFVAILSVLGIVALWIWNRFPDTDNTVIADEVNLESWVGEYQYSAFGPGLDPISINKGVEYNITIYQEESAYYATIIADGWTTAIHIKAEVAGNEKQVDFIFEENLPDGIPCAFEAGDSLFSFCKVDGELYTIQNRLSFGLIDTNEKKKCFTRTDEDIPADAPYDFIEGFCNDIRMIKKGDKWGHIHADGTIVIPQYDESYLFIQDYAIVKLDGQCAVIDKHGKQVYKPGKGVVVCGGQEYDMLDFDFRVDGADALPFHGKLVPFQIEGQWGLWSAFHWVIPLPEYQYISEFAKQYALVIDQDKKYCAIDQYGVALPEWPANLEVSFVGPLPLLPDFTNMPSKELPFDPEKLWSKWLEVSYNTYPANNAFLVALQQLQDDAFVPLTSKRNFLHIGDYLLYYTADSSMGPSKLQLEMPDGSTKTLIDSKHGIQGIFFEDRETLCVELTTYVHFEGGECELYFLNLKNGDLKPAYYGTTGSGYSFHHQIYKHHHYLFKHAKRASDLGDADDIFLQDKDGEFHQIIEYAASFNFIEDYIFYLGFGKQELYRTDLLGQNQTLVYTFDIPIWSFEIQDKTIFYRDEHGEYETDFPVAYQISPEKPIEQGELSRYRLTPDYILEYKNDTGEFIPLLGNFRQSLLTVKGDWLYFRVYRSGEINQYEYWKIKKDGTDLTRLD